MLVTTQNPSPLISRSQIRQIRTISGPGWIWDYDTGVSCLPFGQAAGS